jgi:epoxide hydrolase-like predicted phosphatase
MENIIFDLDGVLLSNDHTLLLKDFVDSKDYLKFDNIIFKSNEWNKLDNGDITLNEAIESLILKNSKEDSKIIIDIMNNWQTKKQVDLKLVRYIKQLKNAGYKLYILSNLHKEMYDYLKAKDIFLKYFDGEVISYKEHLMKPNLEIYKLLINRYSLKEKDSLFIDDKMVNLNSAKELGINTFLYEYKDSAKLKDFLANDLDKRSGREL